MFRKKLERFFKKVSKSYTTPEESLEKVSEKVSEKYFQRKVGERFEHEETLLEVTEKQGCTGCFFYDTECHDLEPTLGTCISAFRDDSKPVIFTEVTKEATKDIVTPKNMATYPHYFAKVPNFTHVDIYHISEMFKLNSYQHHMVKKTIATGKRGVKDQVKDLQEVIATANAWIEAIEAGEN